VIFLLKTDPNRNSREIDVQIRPIFCNEINLIHQPTIRKDYEMSQTLMSAQSNKTEKP